VDVVTRRTRDGHPSTGPRSVVVSNEARPRRGKARPFTTHRSHHEADRSRSRVVSAPGRNHDPPEQTSESAENVSSVTFDAGVTAIIYTGEHQSTLLLVQIPIPGASRRTPAAMIPTHGRWTRSRRQVTIACALRCDRPTHPGSLVAARCAPVRLPPSARDQLPAICANEQCGARPGLAKPPGRRVDRCPARRNGSPRRPTEPTEVRPSGPDVVP
jgi:hypothetical protein